jgi:hypothetical protein
MGFLKFIGRDVQKPGEQKNANTYPIPSPEVYATRPIVPPPPPPPEKKKRQKDDISDFFDVDICNIFKHEPEPADSKGAAGGEPVSKYVLGLTKPELSVFNRVDIFLHAGGSYDLHFTGNSETISDDLIAFVNYCAGKLGPDFMQKKAFSENDARDMWLGVFSRIWNGRMRIENIHFTLSLTLYNIHPKQER